MELWVPSQTLDIHNIHLEPFQPQISQKILMAPIKYIDNNVTLDSLVILTPPIEVIHHDIQTGRLILSLADQAHFATKLNMLQSYLASTLFLHQQTFFGFVNPCLNAEFFRRMFFPLVYNKKLTLYMGVSSRSVRVYDNGAAAAAAATATATTEAPQQQQQQGMHRTLAQGEKVRIAFQIQGISILTSPALTILQMATPSIATQTDASGSSVCKIRFQQNIRAIYCL